MPSSILSLYFQCLVTVTFIFQCLVTFTFICQYLVTFTFICQFLVTLALFSNVQCPSPLFFPVTVAFISNVLYLYFKCPMLLIFIFCVYCSLPSFLRSCVFDFIFFVYCPSTLFLKFCVLNFYILHPVSFTLIL